MIISSNAAYKSIVSDYTMQTSNLQQSMLRLSSGERFSSAGEAPADLGISERFRAQISGAEAAGRVMQNGINMFQSTDSWLQQASDMVSRMSELAIAAADGSKNQGDRQNLDLEFQQLKQEIARVAEAGKYNGNQVNGKTAVAVWDAVQKRIMFSQPDGSNNRSINVDLRSGNSASNAIRYGFESSQTGFVGDFTFTSDGKSLVYTSQQTVTSALSGGVALAAQKTLMTLNLASNTIQAVNLKAAGGTAPNTAVRIITDEKGRVWVSNPSTAGVAAAGTRNYSISLLNTRSTELDHGGAASANSWAGGITIASGYSNFAVNNDFIYYVRSQGGARQFVKQSIYSETQTQVLIASLSASFNMQTGNRYAISKDGQYIAFANPDGVNNNMQMDVINTSSGQKAVLQLGLRANSITALGFDANNRLYWTDTGGAKDQNVINKVIITPGAVPNFSAPTAIYQANAGHVGTYSSAIAQTNGMGLSVGGGDPGSNYKFQVGPDPGQAVEFTVGDVRIVQLGISTLDVLTQDNANTAIAALQDATDIISNNRATMGSEVSRLTYIYAANRGYIDNISAAESRIRDVDVASEAAKMAQAQVASQASTAVLLQFNQSRAAILSLLR